MHVVVARLHHCLLRVMQVPGLYIVAVKPIWPYIVVPQRMRVPRAITLLVLPSVGRDNSLKWGLGLISCPILKWTLGLYSCPILKWNLGLTDGPILTRLEVHRLGKLGSAILRFRNLTDLHTWRLDEVTHLWTLGLTSCPILMWNLGLTSCPVPKWNRGLTSCPVLKWNLELTNYPILKWLSRVIFRERHSSVLPILVLLSSEELSSEDVISDILRLRIDDCLCFLDDVEELVKV